MRWQKEVCGWAIDQTTLITVRAKGCDFVGVRTIDTKDIYIAPISLWFDRKIFKEHNYEGIGNGGTLQRLLYLEHFVINKGKTELKI